MTRSNLVEKQVFCFVLFVLHILNHGLLREAKAGIETGWKWRGRSCCSHEGIMFTGRPAPHGLLSLILERTQDYSNPQLDGPFPVNL